MNKDVLNIDGDYIIYAAGFTGETRSIKAVERQSGNEYEFKNRTEMYGRSRAKDSGWIGEQNLKRETPLSVDDFDIYDIQTPAPIEHSLSNTKSLILKASALSGIKDRKIFVGRGESFRVEASTVLKYKSGRENAIRPYYKDDILDYMVKHHNATIVEGIEVDDQVVINAFEDPRNVICGVDKDSLGTHSRVFNPNKPELGIRDCRCFGDLWLEEKTNAKGVVSREVKGYGRKFFYFQWCYGDDIDTYRANAATSKDWGEMSAYNMLKDCTNDREAVAAVKRNYQTLYPESSRIIGWRGDEIEVDWKYMASEIFTMARMLRTPDEKLCAEEVFTKFGLWA